MAGYNVGYAFFIHSHAALALGIDYFERNALPAGGPLRLPVHHTGIVTGINSCVESHWQTGVAFRTLQEYLVNPDVLIVFRRPVGWTADLGRRIALAAQSRVGAPYNKGLILSMLCSNSMVGRLVNRIFRGAPERWVANRLDNRKAFICSELVVWSFNQMPELRGKGCLSRPENTIDPQELFVDEALFEPPSPTA